MLIYFALTKKKKNSNNPITGIMPYLHILLTIIAQCVFTLSSGHLSRDRVGADVDIHNLYV